MDIKNFIGQVIVFKLIVVTERNPDLVIEESRTFDGDIPSLLNTIRVALRMAVCKHHFIPQYLADEIKTLTVGDINISLHSNMGKLGLVREGGSYLIESRRPK